jgi:hypothetical protein
MAFDLRWCAAACRPRPPLLRQHLPADPSNRSYQHGCVQDASFPSAEKIHHDQSSSPPPSAPRTACVVRVTSAPARSRVGRRTSYTLLRLCVVGRWWFTVVSSQAGQQVVHMAHCRVLCV